MTPELIVTIACLTLLTVLFIIVRINEKHKECAIKYPVNNIEEDYTKLAIAIQQSESLKQLGKCFNLMKSFQFKYGRTFQGQSDVDNLCELYENKRTSLLEEAV